MLSSVVEPIKKRCPDHGARVQQGIFNRSGEVGSCLSEDDRREQGEEDNGAVDSNERHVQIHKQEEEREYEDGVKGAFEGTHLVRVVGLERSELAGDRLSFGRVFFQIVFHLNYKLF